jgi:hypothetical protein
MHVIILSLAQTMTTERVGSSSTSSFVRTFFCCVDLAPSLLSPPLAAASFAIAACQFDYTKRQFNRNIIHATKHVKVAPMLPSASAVTIFDNDTVGFSCPCCVCVDQRKERE